METVFKENIEIILSLIDLEIIQLINENYKTDTFYLWVTDSEWDFKYIYEMNFKRCLLPFFTVETELILSYYSQNLYYALQAYYEKHRTLNDITSFISSFIKYQFKTIDYNQLFLEN